MSLITKTVGIAAIALIAGSASAQNTVAHWTFDSEADFLAGVARDVTGNGNDLTLHSFGNPSAANKATFSTDTFDTPYANTGSVRFNGTRNGPSGNAGDYFRTVESAAINSMTFDSGYTVEAMFKVEAPYDPNENRWMGTMSRSGKPNGDSPATLAISNLGEIQWQTQDVDRLAEQAIWSPVLFEPNNATQTEYVHVAAVNYKDDDGNWRVDMYINGFIGFRNIISTEHNGLAAYDGSTFVIGANHWANGLSGAFNGWIDDIRITDGALDSTQFTNVIPAPGTAALLGLGGLAAARRRR